MFTYSNLILLAFIMFTKTIRLSYPSQSSFKNHMCDNTCFIFVGEREQSQICHLIGWGYKPRHFASPKLQSRQAILVINLNLKMHIFFFEMELIQLCHSIGLVINHATLLILEPQIKLEILVINWNLNPHGSCLGES